MKINIDCHVHCALGGGNRLSKNDLIQDTPDRRRYLTALVGRYYSLGVTRIRDGGDRYALSKAIAPIARDQGMQWLTPHIALYKEGCYGKFLGRAVANARDGFKRIRELKKEGVDFIKLVHSGMMSLEEYGATTSMGFAPQELADLIACAQDNGLHTMVHVNLPKGIIEAARAGVTSIEHGYGIDEEAMWAIAENQSTWVPTLAPFANMCQVDDKHPLAMHRPFAQKYYENHRKAVAKASEIVVIIAVGSDTGATQVEHGTGSLDEWQYVIDCGLPEETAYRHSSDLMDRFQGSP